MTNAQIVELLSNINSKMDAIDKKLDNIEVRVSTLEAKPQTPAKTSTKKLSAKQKQAMERRNTVQGDKCMTHTQFTEHMVQHGKEWKEVQPLYEKYRKDYTLTGKQRGYYDTAKKLGWIE